MNIVQHSFGNLRGCHSKRGSRLGWALELSVLVQMNSLPEQHRPKSDDPDFWAMWSVQDGGMVERNVDWKAIADDWQRVNAPTQEKELENDCE